jgi:hypothetical protein
MWPVSDMKFKCVQLLPGVAVHGCNPSYSGSGDQEDHGSRPSPSKKLSSSHLNKQAGHCGTHLQSKLSERHRWKEHGLRLVWAKSGEITSLKNWKMTKKQKGLEVWLKWQVQDSEFKPQYHKKKKSSITIVVHLLLLSWNTWNWVT